MSDLGKWRGTIELVKSDYDSPGAGSREVVFNAVPELGHEFFTWEPETGDASLKTGTVMDLRSPEMGVLEFDTKRSTYRLTFKEGTCPSS